MTDEIKKYQEELIRLQKEVHDKDNEIRMLEDEVQALNDKLRDQKLAYRKLMNKYDDLNNEYSRLKTENIGLIAQVTLLCSMAELSFSAADKKEEIPSFNHSKRSAVSKLTNQSRRNQKRHKQIKQERQPKLQRFNQLARFNYGNNNCQWPPSSYMTLNPYEYLLGADNLYKEVFMQQLVSNFKLQILEQFAAQQAAAAAVDKIEGNYINPSDV